MPAQASVDAHGQADAFVFPRRDFLRFCSFMTAVLALPPRYTLRIAGALRAAATAAVRPSVIWLEFQDCAGDSESFLRTSHPTAVDFLFDILSLDYHELLMAPAGAAAELSLTQAMERAPYLVVVEGSIPTSDGGIYCTVAGKTAVQSLGEVAVGAAAIIAVGTCASFGGVPAAAPNPTGAVGVRDLVNDRPVLNLSGCPVNAVNLAATLVHYLTFGELPATDDLGRPLFAYGALLHDHCPRRGHFDTGRFVRAWGDEGHRQGWCLYRMGCKGPAAQSNCPLVGWNDNTSWPIAAGHPCLACTEPGFWDTSTPFYRWMGEEILPTPGEREREGEAIGIALGVGGAVLAAGAGAAVLARQRRSRRSGSTAAAQGDGGS
ncbi:MAG: hydrogenase small subunit [Actinomycetota bacterium]